MCSEADFFKNIAESITFYRRHSRMTQKDLAQAAGISVSHLSKIEAANVNVRSSLTMIYRLANAMNIMPYKLIAPVAM